MFPSHDRVEVDAKVASANTYTDIQRQVAIDHTDQGDAALYSYVNGKNGAQDLVITDQQQQINQNKLDSESRDQTLQNNIDLKANTTYVDQQISDTRDYADSKVQQTVLDGVTDSAPSQDAVYDRLQVKQNLPTGYLTGWQLSVNTLDNTKFDIAAGRYRDWETDRKSTRLNSSHSAKSRMPSSA